MAARWAAFLRGVSPMNAKMPELVRAFEAAGFDEVGTVLSSGNVVFGARSRSAEALEKRAEAAMERELGRSFLTIVRAVDELEAMLASDPWGPFELARGSKRVVTFLRDSGTEALALPFEGDGARILAATGREVFTAYVPDPKRGGQFMRVIEDALGQAVTTRSWETVEKVVKRARG